MDGHAYPCPQNCHFDPLPDKHCSHQEPCCHRAPSECDLPTKPSVRSWSGKRADFELSQPEVTLKHALAREGPPPAKVFFSSTRTPNAHVGDPSISSLGWKTSTLWAETSKQQGGYWLWEPACCVEQGPISRGQVSSTDYALDVIAAIEACDVLWVHVASDYYDSLHTVLELAAWHASKTIHPSNTKLLNSMHVTSISGRTVR